MLPAVANALNLVRNAITAIPPQAKASIAARLSQSLRFAKTLSPQEVFNRATALIKDNPFTSVLIAEAVISEAPELGNQLVQGLSDIFSDFPEVLDKLGRLTELIDTDGKPDTPDLSNIDVLKEQHALIKRGVRILGSFEALVTLRKIASLEDVAFANFLAVEDMVS
jgi:hypothetical protein